MAQTDRNTDGHGDSMTDPAQRVESVKTDFWITPVKSGLDTVRLPGKTGICSELTLGQLRAALSSLW